MAELALDDHHRDPLVSQLHSVGVPELMGRHAAAYPRSSAGPAQLPADRCRGPWSPAARTMKDAEQRTDRQLAAILKPRVKRAPPPRVQADLPAFAILPGAD